MAGAVDAILERGVDAIAAGLAIVAPPGLVYAVGIMSTGEEELDPGFPVIGLERDREAALREDTPYEAFYRVWNASDYATEASPVPDLRFDPDFLRLEEEARDTLRARGVWDPQRFVLNRIARRLGQRPPPWPVTDDFVVFSMPADGLGDDLLENVRFSARPDAAAKLVQRGLLPADMRKLPGFPRPPVV
jgi:hypothetical protein